jgi:uncharacterized membrane protein
MVTERWQDSEEHKQDNEKVLGRLLAFSDGVFAIAILLLLIDIRLPEGTTEVNLGAALIELWPKYLAFLLSFVVIGLYWSAHVRLFREIVRYDQNLIWLNLLFLLFIVAIPFPTSVLSLHLFRLSVVVYATMMACAGYMHTFLRIYAGKGHRLVNNRHSPRYIRKGILFSLFAPVGFTVSIGIGFFSAVAALVLWVVVFGVHFIFQRRVRPMELQPDLALRQGGGI